MKFNKKISTLIFSGIIFFSSNLTLFASTSNNQEISTGTEYIETTPFDLNLKDGSVTNATDFTTSIILNRNNGRNVNFWIKNNGTTNATITINGTGTRTFAPGASGHITASVTGTSQRFNFKAAPSPNGGRISIDYKIAQRN